MLRQSPHPAALGYGYGTQAAKVFLHTLGRKPPITIYLRYLLCTSLQSVCPL